MTLSDYGVLAAAGLLVAAGFVGIGLAGGLATLAAVVFGLAWLAAS